MISSGPPGGQFLVVLLGGGEAEAGEVLAVLFSGNQVLKLVKVSSLRAVESVVFIFLEGSFLVRIFQ